LSLIYLYICTSRYLLNILSKSAAETPVHLHRLKIAATDAKLLKYITVVLGILHG
jgi:hypothetical protein